MKWASESPRDTGISLVSPGGPACHRGLQTDGRVGQAFSRKAVGSQEPDLGLVCSLGLLGGTTSPCSPQCHPAA